MLIETFLPLSEIREKCGVTGTGADALLTRHRAAATAHVERLTRRNILDRVITVRGIPQWTDAQRRLARPPLHPQPHQPLVFQIADARPLSEPLIMRYRIESDQSSFELDGTFTVQPGNTRAEEDRFLVVQNEWPQTPDLSIPYQAQLAAGMGNDDAPPEFQTAVLFLAREMFLGSMLDQLKPGIVERILGDYAAISYNSLDADYLRAEIQP